MEKVGVPGAIMAETSRHVTLHLAPNRYGPYPTFSLSKQIANYHRNDRTHERPNDRYLRWAQAIDDPRGVSHANECLARMYRAVGDVQKSEQHGDASLEQCRRRGDINNHGRVTKGCP